MNNNYNNNDLNNGMNNNVDNGMNNGFNNFQQTPYHQPVVNQQPMVQPVQTQPVPPMSPQQQVYGQQQAFNQAPQQPKKSNKLIIIIGALIVIGLIVGGVFLLGSKNNESDNNDAVEQGEENNSNSGENGNNTTNKNKYVYASSLSESEKVAIIEADNNKYQLVETVEINQLMGGYYDKENTSRDMEFFVNRLLKFKSPDSNEGIVLLDYTIYGNSTVYFTYFLRSPLVDNAGNSLDDRCIDVNAGYHCIGPDVALNLPNEYNVLGDYRYSLGYQDRKTYTEYDTKISGYWYYKVNDVTAVDLNNLYLYYWVEDDSKNIYEIKNSEYNYKYYRVKLKNSEDSIPNGVYNEFDFEKNTTKTIKYYNVNDGSKYGKFYYYKKGEDTRYEFDMDLTVTLSNYRIEEWGKKKVLIVPYTINKVTDDEIYFKYRTKAIEIKLIDKDCRAYEPLSINEHMDEELYDLRKNTKLEAIYILPDDFDVSSAYIGYPSSLASSYSKTEYVVPLDNLK